MKKVMKMRTIYDVQQLLKRFGTIIYIGDRLADLELIEARTLSSTMSFSKRISNGLIIIKARNVTIT